MKYIDTDKLKKEVEKRRKFHDNAIISFCNSQTIRLTHSAGLKEDEEILSIIDSLQQEQPKMDLDELIVDFLLNNYEFLIESDSKAVVQKLAHHFYELGLNARKV